MRRAFAGLPLALEFLTVIRLRGAAEYDGPALGASLGWFPLVGLAIGSCLVAFDWAAGRLFPPSVVAALLVAAIGMLTRALHIDGLADSADGLFGGHTPERRLAIMRDSRNGSFGVAAVVLVLLLTHAALLSLPAASRRGVLLLAPALGRWAMVLAVAAFPYARPEGLGRLYHEHARPWPALVAGGSAFLLSAVLFGMAGLALLALTSLLALGAGWFAYRRLGGLTGDIYGAIGVISETALFLLASGDTHGWLRPWLPAWR